LESLRKGLTEIIAKIRRSSIIDEKTLKELIRGIQRELLKADVSVEIVAELSRKVEERIKKEKIPPGFSKQELLIRIIYEELIKILGGESKYSIRLKKGTSNVIMLVGIQGSGKTTTAGKLAYFFKNKGFKTALVCADNYRPGAVDQLRQLAEKVGVAFYGEENAHSAIEVAKKGVEKFRNEKYEVIIVDTAGRHKKERELIEEMKEIASAISPDEIILVLDGTIGRQAGTQAEAFHKATPIGSIIITKLDGAARGGGALAAVTKTGASISFIGMGEKIEELELFDPPSFVSRLLGMGDLKQLIERFRKAEALEKLRLTALASGKFTLLDMKEQLESLTKMGPLRKLLELLPGGFKLPEGFEEASEENIHKWVAIMNSMTQLELLKPEIINRSRMLRIAKGSGTTLRDVKNLLEAYNKSRKLLKKMMRRAKRFKGLDLTGI